jgi:hypothetical protein
MGYWYWLKYFILYDEKKQLKTVTPSCSLVSFSEICQWNFSCQDKIPLPFLWRGRGNQRVRDTIHFKHNVNIFLGNAIVLCGVLRAKLIFSHLFLLLYTMYYIFCRWCQVLKFTYVLYMHCYSYASVYFSSVPLEKG